MDRVEWKMSVWSSGWLCRVVDGCVEYLIVVWRS